MTLKGTSFDRVGRNWAQILLPSPSSHIEGNRTCFLIHKIGLMTGISQNCWENPA